MIIWPDRVVRDLARRRSVIFLGSGISRWASTEQGRRPQTWEQFLRQLCDQVTPRQHIQSLLKERDYLTACEVLRAALGRADFNQALRNEYLSPRYRHANIHEEIFRLDSRIVATPNFDKIYETYANHEAQGSIVLKHQYDPDVADTLRSTDRCILKVHGTIDSVDRLIFTRKEYAEARHKYHTFYRLLEALALTHTFIFLGCGFSDPDIRLLLEDTYFKHPGASPHYFLLSRNSVHKSVQEVVEQTMNLQIVSYSSAGDHAELGDSISNLADLVEAERHSLQETANW